MLTVDKFAFNSKLIYSSLTTRLLSWTLNLPLFFQPRPSGDWMFLIYFNGTNLSLRSISVNQCGYDQIVETVIYNVTETQHYSNISASWTIHLLKQNRHIPDQTWRFKSQSWNVLNTFSKFGQSQSQHS